MVIQKWLKVYDESSLVRRFPQAKNDIGVLTTTLTFLACGRFYRSSSGGNVPAGITGVFRKYEYIAHVTWLSGAGREVQGHICYNMPKPYLGPNPTDVRTGHLIML